MAAIIIYWAHISDGYDNLPVDKAVKLTLSRFKDFAASKEFITEFYNISIASSSSL